MADYTLSSGNVFKDLGLPEPEEKLAKAELAYKINYLIAAQGMTQKEASGFLGISRYKMTQLRNGRLNNFTIEHLNSLLEMLEHHIKRSAYDWIQRGVDAYQKGNADEAINYYNKVIALDSDASTVSISYSIRGIAYLSKKVYESAIKDFSKALELGMDNPRIYLLRGWTYHLQKNYDHAIEDFTKAIELNLHNADVYTYRGTIYYHKGKYNEAIEDFTKAIELDPEDVIIRNNRGVVYRDKGELDLAIEDHNKTIQLNPDYAEAYNNRAAIYGDKGEFDLAIEDHNKAIQLNPDYAEAYYNRGLIYSNKGELNNAIKDFTKAIKLEPNYTNAYYNRGMAYGNEGKLNYAIRDFTKVIELEPNYINTYNNPWKTRLHIGVCEDVKTDLTTGRNTERNLMVPAPRDYELSEMASTMLASQQGG